MIGFEQKRQVFHFAIIIFLSNLHKFVHFIILEAKFIFFYRRIFIQVEKAKVRGKKISSEFSAVKVNCKLSELCMFFVSASKIKS